ncbi:zn(2)-C6 fungal-type DNA-binding domain protein [Colletotrichum tofieldiae]|nr:zn(2)-C6 fungal-type DNA-binding domain protein [Colletotrichum tofieldiae]GKT92345.1 Zn(II)-C6 fungal-type DNA-binding domain protein [Colletotrichum tofieldiae]
MVSIDGQSQPPVFLTEVLPWMLQSPLFPNIGILMSSMTQSLEQGVEISKNPESLALKARVLSIIADYMQRPFDAIAVEMVRSIVNLVVMEWFWGADESMFAHMRGIKRMIKIRKGMRGLGDIVGESIMILTDYEIACAFETDLYWLENDPARDEELPVPKTWPDCYDSPLLASSSRFESIAGKLGLCASAAKILDDVRFLTVSVTSASGSASCKSKIRTTASWLYGKLRDRDTVGPTVIASEEEWILETIRIAALIYSWSIKSMRQISRFDDNETLEAAYLALTSVSMTTWKQIPGVFLWIMLVAAPNAAPDAKGRFVRRKMAVTGLSIGFEDFVLGISYLKAFWSVQQWIAKEGDAGVQRLEDKWSSGLGREARSSHKNHENIRPS